MAYGIFGAHFDQLIVPITNFLKVCSLKDTFQQKCFLALLDDTLAIPIYFEVTSEIKYEKELTRKLLRVCPNTLALYHP